LLHVANLHDCAFVGGSECVYIGLTFRSEDTDAYLLRSTAFLNKGPNAEK